MTVVARASLGNSLLQIRRDPEKAEGGFVLEELDDRRRAHRGAIGFETLTEAKKYANERYGVSLTSWVDAR